MLTRALAVLAAAFLFGASTPSALATHKSKGHPSKPPVYKTPKFKNKHGSKKTSHPPNRSKQAKKDFRGGNPCPSTGKITGGCPGYEIQHKTPISEGGVEADTNLQWVSKS